MQTTFQLGIGIGWRPELARTIERIPSLGFVEVTAENMPPGNTLPAPIRNLQQRGVKVIPHGISLSLGGADPLRLSGVQRLEQLAGIAAAPLVSEHIAFVRAGGVEVGHLTPLPRTKVAVDVVVENVKLTQQFLSVPIALENIASVLQWPNAELSEAEFVSEIVLKSGALFLLDISNLYASVRNLRVDPIKYLQQVPLDRISYVHMGGGIERNGVYQDTHAHPVPQEALELLEELCTRVEVPGVMLERDDDFPPEAALMEEMERIGAAIDRGRARRLGAMTHAG